MRKPSLNSRTIILIATGVLTGIGLAYLVIRYLDKIIELVETLKKRTFLRFEIESQDVGCPDLDLDESSQAFHPGYDTELSPDGTPQPNNPADE
jgi:hypothetical protein